MTEPPYEYESGPAYDYESGPAYEYAEEPQPQGRRTWLWVVGGLAAAAIAACVCMLCLVVAFFVGYTLNGATEPPPTEGVAPTPVITYPAEAIVGQEVTFDGSQSIPGSSPIGSYDWTMGDGNSLIGAIVTHRYNAPGVYPVTLSVTGEDRLTTVSEPVEITILASGPTPTPTPGQGQPPQAIIVGPTQGIASQEVTFDGRQSIQGSSPISSYEWQLGDGNVKSGPIITHIYNAPGNYQVTLTVTGGDGLANTSGPWQIVVSGEGGASPTQPPPDEGQPPQPVINYPSQAKVGQEVTFDGTGSQPGSSAIASYQWDLGDGSTATGPMVVHAYSAPGTYLVTLLVTGQDGLSSSGEPVQITILGEGAAPENTPAPGGPIEAVMSFPPTAGADEEITFDGSQSKSGSSAMNAFVWDFGDGAIWRGAVTTHEYETPGQYQVSLTVVNKDGQSDTAGPSPIEISD